VKEKPTFDSPFWGTFPSDEPTYETEISHMQQILYIIPANSGTFFKLLAFKSTIKLSVTYKNEHLRTCTQPKNPDIFLLFVVFYLKPAAYGGNTQIRQGVLLSFLAELVRNITGKDKI
jgi:hypothetical protein